MEAVPRDGGSRRDAVAQGSGARGGVRIQLDRGIGRDRLDSLRGDFVEALLAPDARLARTLLAEAADGDVPVALLYLDVIHPAMVEVGERWERCEISVAQEQLATQITQLAMVELASRFDVHPGAGERRLAIVGSSPGEQHAIGLRMVADFLESQGWTTLTPAPGAGADEIAALAAEHGPDMVAISTSLSGNLLAVGRLCAKLRHLPEPPLIVAGGRAYDGDAARARAVGADEYATDPEQLLAVLRVRFGDG